MRAGRVIDPSGALHRGQDLCGHRLGIEGLGDATRAVLGGDPAFGTADEGWIPVIEAFPFDGGPSGGCGGSACD